jgi:hypothetical protein
MIHSRELTQQRTKGAVVQGLAAGGTFTADGTSHLFDM